MKRAQDQEAAYQKANKTEIDARRNVHFFLLRLKSLVKSMYLLNPNSPLLLESEVLTNLTPTSSESWDSSDLDKFTTESSSESTKPQPTCSDELSPTSPSDTHPESPSEDSSSKEDTERSTSKEFPFHPTKSSNNLSESTESTQLKILSTRFTQLDLISRRPTTFCGHSSLTAQEEDFQPRDILSKEEEIGETEKSSSTNWSPRCSDSI